MVNIEKFLNIKPSKNSSEKPDIKNIKHNTAQSAFQKAPNLQTPKKASNEEIKDQEEIHF